MIEQRCSYCHKLLYKFEVREVSNPIDNVTIQIKCPRCNQYGNFVPFKAPVDVTSNTKIGDAQ